MMQNLQMTVDSVDTMQSIFELGADCNVILQGRIGQVHQSPSFYIIHA